VSILDKTEKEKAHKNDSHECNKIDEILCIHHMKQQKDLGGERTEFSIGALQPQLSIKLARFKCDVIHKMMNKISRSTLANVPVKCWRVHWRL